MATSNGSKGNPASHRMMNKELKAKRQRSWARGERRKVENRKANNAAHMANALLLKVHQDDGDLVALSVFELDSKGKRLRPSKVLRKLHRAAQRDAVTFTDNGMGSAA